MRGRTHLPSLLVATPLLVFALGAPAAGGAQDRPQAQFQPPGLAGWWEATVRHAGTSDRFALELVEDGEPGFEARLSIPTIDAWGMAIGRAQVEEDSLTIGRWQLRWDRQAREISGVLPASLVPVYELAFVLRPASDPRTGARATPGAESGLRAPAAVWTADLGSPIWAGLLLAQDAIVVGTDGGELVALEAVDGVERWRLRLDGSLRARPTLDGAEVLVVDDAGILRRVALHDGTEIWRRSLDEEPPPARVAPGQPGSRYDHLASSVTVDGERAFVGCAAGHLHALAREDGRELWRFSTGDSVRSTPAVARGLVVFGSFDGNVHAVDAESGVEAWRHDTGAPVVSTPAIVGDRAVVGSRSYDLLALALDSGEVGWTFYRWFSWIESSAVLAGDSLYVGSSDAQLLHALDPTTGTLRWAYDTGGSAWSTPAVADELVFIGSVGVEGYVAEQRGGFHAVDRGSGVARWRLLVESGGETSGAGRYTGFVSTPALGAGRVYVAGLDGVVRALPLVPPE